MSMSMSMIKILIMIMNDTRDCVCNIVMLCYEENDTRRTRSIELKHTSYILVDLHEI